jgi:hypothetical protein
LIAELFFFVTGVSAGIVMGVALATGPAVVGWELMLLSLVLLLEQPLSPIAIPASTRNAVITTTDVTIVRSTCSIPAPNVPESRDVAFELHELNCAIVVSPPLPHAATGDMARFQPFIKILILQELCRI